jgi:hypothetical protein
MRKALIIILFAFGFSIHSFSFSPVNSISDLIEKSDYIVFGEIFQIGTLNIKIIIHDKIKGELRADTIQVRKFNNWSHASEYEKYEIGQKLIFFLWLNSENIIYGMGGGGNVDEIQVINDTAYIENFMHQEIGGQKIPDLHPYAKYHIFEFQVVMDGLKTYVDNLELIEREYLVATAGTVQLFSGEVQSLSQNEFYQFAIQQKVLTLH